MDDLNNYLNQKKKSEAILKFLQGVGFIFLAFKILYFFKPNATQRGLSLLYKNLFVNNIITNEIMNQYRTINPKILH